MNRKLKYFFIKHPSLENKLYFTYHFFKDPNSVERPINGKRKDCRFYVIRPRTNCIEGLLSLVIFILRKIEYAERKKLIPIVDMKNYKTQYSDGVNNVWEFFFEQPSKYDLDYVYKQPYILSGNHFIDRENYKLFEKDIFFHEESFWKSCDIVKKYVIFSKAILELVSLYASQLNIENCIGVLVRGTDYIKLRPVGECVQPSVEEVFCEVDKMLLKYARKKIFLVTEDNDIFLKFKSKYGDLLLTIGDDFLVKDYKGKSFLSKDGSLSNDKKGLAEMYLTKIILLSKCKYLVSGITYGSRFAYVLNMNQYEDVHIFDLGIYK